MTINREQLTADIEADATIDENMEMLGKIALGSLPYIQKIGRAIAYAIAGYLLLWLQPHFDFSFTAFAFAVFFVSLVNRGVIIANMALALVLVAIFVPVGLVQTFAAHL